MIKAAAALVSVLLPSAAIAQAIPAGGWDVTSTLVDLSVPGAPGFLLRMAKGKSKAEHKCLSAPQAGAGIVALLAPDPKAQCRVLDIKVAEGRYAQSLACPQRKGDPVRVVRAGTYDASGFAGRVEMTGQTPKGGFHIVMTQRATRVGPTCRG
jgi:hypothetical protein